jgi:hypothetical protein
MVNAFNLIRSNPIFDSKARVEPSGASDVAPLQRQGPSPKRFIECDNMRVRIKLPIFYCPNFASKILRVSHLK